MGGGVRPDYLFPGSIDDFSLSPDNAFIVASGASGLVLYRASVGRDYISRSTDLDPNPLHPVFSADGKYLAGVGRKDALRVWQLNSEGLPPRIRVYSEGVIKVAAFGPAADGQLLATADETGTVRLWKLTPRLSDDLLKEACSRLIRNMTQAEWEKYVGGSDRQKTCEELP
jgi:WD40 repeat protein